MVEANSQGVVWGIGYDHTAWVYTGGYGGGCFQGEGSPRAPRPEPSWAFFPLVPAWVPCPRPGLLSQCSHSTNSWLTGDLHHCQPPPRMVPASTTPPS